MVASTSTVCTDSPAAHSRQLKMFKKTAVEKRLRKISKQEAASVKLLEKQVEITTRILYVVTLGYLGTTTREGSTGKREDHRERSEQSLPWGTKDPAGGGEIVQEII